MGETYDGWSFDSFGNMYGPAGQAFDVNGVAIPQGVSSSGWSDFLSGLGGVAANVANVGINTWSKQTLMQQAQNGQQYVEGQRLLMQRQTMGSIPPLYLLIGAGVLFVVLLKK